MLRAALTFGVLQDFLVATVAEGATFDAGHTLPPANL